MSINKQSKTKKVIRFFKYMMIGVVTLAIVLGVSGFIYETVASDKAIKNYPPPGELVDIQGNTLHIHEQGEENGNPTVVIEAGGGSWSLAWEGVQTKLAEHTKVITYDRAGLGWSGELHTPRTAEQISTELMGLLRETGNAGPYILVGHSLGGLYQQVFAEKYSDEVAGMIFVDMRPPAFDDQFPLLKENIEKQTKNMSLYKGLSQLGIVRFLADGLSHPAYSEEIRLTNSAIGFQAKSFDALKAEMEAIELLDQEILRLDTAQLDVPVTVISRGIAEEFPEMSAKQNEQIEIAWQTYQREYAASFRQGKLVIAEKSAHNIQLEQPDLIIDEIRELIERIKH